MIKTHHLGIVVLATIACALSASAQNGANGMGSNGSYERSGPRDILLHVTVSPSPWADCDLASQLEQFLTRRDGYRVDQVGRQPKGAPAFPRDVYDLDSLFEWGREMGARYLLIVDITSRGLVRKKTFDLPLVVHRYETRGVIEGELRLLDLSRGRLLAAEPIEFSQRARHVLQGGADDDIGDPSLHLTAPEKISFFRTLDDKLCQYIGDRFRLLATGR